MDARSKAADAVTTGRAAVACCVALSGLFFCGCSNGAARQPIRIGILHSLSGTMAFSEKPVVEATLLAIEDLNARGGVLGRPVEPVTADAQSDPATFASEGERLITRDKVAALFGCWTSASRKHLRTVVERHNQLLFYPVQYEGLELSPNIVYAGAAPNQQIIPAVKWCFDHLGTRFFLVGSDYVFPRTANAIIKDQVGALGGEIVGEEYILLGGGQVDGVAEKIVRARPSVILNTINGDSNIAFFHALRKRGLAPGQIPVMSFSIAEREVASIGPALMAGDYAAWNYFQSLSTPQNREFVQRFQARYGTDQVVSDPMEAAYVAVHLWAQAVEAAGTEDSAAVRRNIGDQSYLGPGGMVYVDRTTQHTWKVVRLGRIRKDGQFDVVWSSEHPVRPVPYPAYRQKAEWDDFLLTLYKGWGGRWVNPGGQ
jgi:urea transport system substrate-binding protein